MIKIKFFGWTSSEKLMNVILNYYDWDKDINYNYKYCFTYGDDYTHVILFNKTSPKLNIPKENVIGLAQEPSIFLNIDNDIKFQNYCSKNVGKYYLGKLNTLKKPFIEKMSYQLPGIVLNNSLQDLKKTKNINYVLSNKKKTGKGLLYNYRHLILDNICRNKLDIDIYGKCVDFIKDKNDNIKYSFCKENVLSVYKDYKFSIVIENTQEPEYFTEKIIIPLLCGCIPIYLGCKNINNYFKEYIINLTGNLNKDLIIINNILKNPDLYYKKIDVEKIKHIIRLKNIIYENFL